MYHVCAWCLQRSERGTRTLELEFQVFVNQGIVLVAEVKPQSSARATNVPNYCPISPAPSILL